MAFKSITVRVIASDEKSITFQSGHTTVTVPRAHIQDLMNNENARMNFVFLQMALLLFRQGINPITAPASAKAAIEAATFSY